MRKKTKIHTHYWVVSINENCPFCSGETFYCNKPDCYLYRCANPSCRQIFSMKNKRADVRND
jgi:hypothetical protein